MALVLLLLLMANACASSRDGGNVELPWPARATFLGGGSRETPVLRLCGGKPGPSGEGRQQRDARDGKNGHATERKKEKRQAHEQRKQPETSVVHAEKRKKRAKEAAGEDSASQLCKGDPAKLGPVSPNKLQTERRKHKKERGRKLPEKTVAGKLGKLAREQGKVKSHRKVSKVTIQEEGSRHEKRKQPTKPSDPNTGDLLRASQNTSKTTIPQADKAQPKLEQSKERPHGMALARRLMRNMGWSGDGHGLGLNGTGIAQPLKVTVKVQKMGIGARHESSFAKQTREFREMEDEAFPTFAAGPPPGAMGRQSGMASRGEAEDAEEGSSVSTSACSSSTAAAAPEHPRLPAAGDVSPAAPKAQDSPASPRAANAPFHRVQADDPEVAEFKRKTGYDYVHRRFKISKERNTVGDRGSISLNPFQGRQFKKQKQKLKERSGFGAIDVNFRNSNRVVFNYDD